MKLAMMALSACSGFGCNQVTFLIVAGMRLCFVFVLETVLMAQGML